MRRNTRDILKVSMNKMRRNTRDILKVSMNNFEETIDINIQKNEKFE